MTETNLEGCSRTPDPNDQLVTQQICLYVSRALLLRPVSASAQLLPRCSSTGTRTTLHSLTKARLPVVILVFLNMLLSNVLPKRFWDLCTDQSVLMLSFSSQTMVRGSEWPPRSSWPRFNLVFTQLQWSFYRTNLIMRNPFIQA